MHQIPIILLAVGIAMAGCERESPGPAYKQSDFAKDPDGDCIRNPAGFYEEEAKTPKGIEEVIFTACQSNVRAEYHGREAQEGAGREQQAAHLEKAMRCSGEAIDAVKALQKVGVTGFRCPDGSQL